MPSPPLQQCSVLALPTLPSQHCGCVHACTSPQLLPQPPLTGPQQPRCSSTRHTEPGSATSALTPLTALPPKARGADSPVGEGTSRKTASPHCHRSPRKTQQGPLHCPCSAGDTPRTAASHCCNLSIGDFASLPACQLPLLPLTPCSPLSSAVPPSPPKASRTVPIPDPHNSPQAWEINYVRAMQQSKHY